jgi:hypothetical protein
MNFGALIDRLLARWREAGVQVPAGASERDILAFEERFGVRLPESFRTYLRAADGMADGDWHPDDLIHFWTLAEISRHLAEPTASEIYPFVPFADYSLDCWVWVFPLDPGGRVPDTVCTYGPTLQNCAHDFEGFVEAYLAGKAGAPRFGERPVPLH